MYDFYFGDKESIEKDPKQWLITIKRMLPRWPNGIPDTEFLAIYDQLTALEADGTFQRDRKMVLVETGSGASTTSTPSSTRLSAVICPPSPMVRL